MTRELATLEQSRKAFDALPIKTAYAIHEGQYAPPRYLVHGLIPDGGLVILAASKGIGKTFLALEMAAAIAEGRPFLSYPTNKARTLFVELELSERRIHERLQKMRISSIGLDMLFSLPTTNAVKTLEYAMGPGQYRFIVVDVIGKLFTGDFNSYTDAYSFLGPLREAANRHGATILLITHNRKGEAEDIVDRLLGSVGLVGCADVVLSLVRQRGTDDAVLHAHGNDIESAEIALRWNDGRNDAPLGWMLSGMDPREAGQTPERRKVLAFLKEKGTVRSADIASHLATSPSNVSNLTDALRRAGLVESPSYGKWRLSLGRVNESGESNETAPLPSREVSPVSSLSRLPYDETARINPASGYIGST